MRQKLFLLFFFTFLVILAPLFVLHRTSDESVGTVLQKKKIEGFRYVAPSWCPSLKVPFRTPEEDNDVSFSIFEKAQCFLLLGNNCPLYAPWSPELVE